MTEYVAVSDNAPSLANDVLITILPIHAQRLYGGDKRFELRKSIPRTVPRRIFLYEAGTNKGITGHFVVERIIAGSPADVWAETKELAASKASFDRYFAGRTLAYAYQVAASVRYRTPVTRDEVSYLEPGFRVPQNFLYLQNLPRLQAYLSDLAVTEAIAAVGDGIVLRNLSAASIQRFGRAVAKHITGAYLETGSDYADNLVNIARLGVDAEGFLTERKLIYEVHVHNRLAGFVVFTLKRGGAVKTGPVILGKAYRNRGVGGTLRRELHAAFLKAGFRKVFATVPATKLPALQYLLSAGYRMEAHLQRQYHTDHDEFVLGYMLTNTLGPGPEFIRPIMPSDQYSEATEVSADVCAFLKDEFSAVFCPVSEGWAEKQLLLAVRQDRLLKPRRVFLARGMGLLMIAVCLLKRGGSAKVILLSRTGHQPSMGGFLEYVAGMLAKGGPVRRVYTVVPLADVDVIESFREFGCVPEGVLVRPYNANSDMLVMGKLL